MTREYTVTAFRAAEELRLWPNIIRPVVHWFLPLCRQSRALVKQARRCIQPVLEKRQRLKKEAEAQGKQIPKFEDAIEWFERTSAGREYDPAIAQLVVSLAAIHTTSDLTSQTLTDLAQHSEILDPVREELASVLNEEG